MNYVNVLMNEVKISEDLIGTVGLATCIGVLLYDWNNKKAIVGHFNSNYNGGEEIEDVMRIYYAIDKMLVDNHMEDDDISYLVIPGGFNQERVNKVAYELDMLMHSYMKMEINESDIKKHQDTESLEFVFDPKNAMFKTDYFFPNDINYGNNMVTKHIR